MPTLLCRDLGASQGYNFKLISDNIEQLCQLFDVIKLKKLYGKEYMGCARSTFVINPQGDLIFARYNVKAKNHVEMLIRELNIAE